jgi:hypothetical protein
MKSLSSHFKSRLVPSEIITKSQDPVFRSSAIFPVIKNSNYTTRISFLGYWFLKHVIKKIELTLTFRNNDGSIISKTSSIIDSPKVFRIELDNLLKENKITENEFYGSIELEVFSSKNLIYPYPAFTINFYNKDFCTSVHSVERTYNNSQDLQENQITVVPEAGFDIYENNNLQSFLAFVNGSLQNDNAIINYTITNHSSKNITGSIDIEKVKPYQTKILKFGKYIKNLEQFLENKAGTITFTHNLKGFFPRFLVGTIQNSFPSISITHSYYDCTSCDSQSDYLIQTNEKFIDSAIAIPLFLKNSFYTDLILYPIFSPSNFTISFDTYDAAGNLLKKYPNFLKIETKNQKLEKINFKNILKHEPNLNQIKSAFVQINSLDGKIPTRLKFGLNVGKNDSKSKLPCNVCFASVLGNSNLENKPSSFHWGSLLNIGNSVFSLSNAGPVKKYSKTANVELTFFREDDLKCIQKTIKIPPYGEYRFELDDNKEIKSFLKNKPGWVTTKADVPFTTGFYFDFSSSGSVAGDHLF